MCGVCLLVCVCQFVIVVGCVKVSVCFQRVLHMFCEFFCVLCVSLSLCVLVCECLVVCNCECLLSVCAAYVLCEFYCVC